MKSNFGDVLEEISREKKTGILSVSVKNDNCLFKVFFRDGMVYHMTHGTCRDSECLNKIPGLDLDACFFMNGAQVDMKAAGIPGTKDIIAEARQAQKVVEWGALAGDPSDNGRGAAQKTVAAALIAQMEEELLNIAGPVAGMVLEAAYGSCNLRKDAPITSGEFRRLIQIISEKLPEEQKGMFLLKFMG